MLVITLNTSPYQIQGIIPTVQIYLAMIDMHCCLGNEKEVQDLYHEMLRNKIEPNDNVFLVYVLKPNY
jgi:pentatricopeptide repeat protein